MTFFSRKIVCALLCSIGLLVALPSYAQTDRGTFLCTSGCGSAMNAAGSHLIADGETQAFIRAVVNVYLFGQQDVPAGTWRPDDTLTVCDGTTCISYKYSPMGAWVQTGTFEDPRTGYANSQAAWGGGIGWGGCGSGSGGSWTLVPVIETWHFTSNTGHSWYESFVVGTRLQRSGAGSQYCA